MRTTRVRSRWWRICGAFSRSLRTRGGAIRFEYRTERVYWGRVTHSRRLSGATLRRLHRQGGERRRAHVRRLWVHRSGNWFVQKPCIDVSCVRWCACAARAARKSRFVHAAHREPHRLQPFPSPRPANPERSRAKLNQAVCGMRPAFLEGRSTAAAGSLCPRNSPKNRR